MPFVLEQLTLANVHETADIRVDAFDGSPAQRAMRPQGKPPSVYEWYRKKHAREMKNDPGTYFIGVRDTTDGELAAYGQWQRDLATDRAAAAGKEQGECEKYSPDSNVACQRDFWDLLHKSERDFMGDTDYWHLQLLTTKKKYQGKGLATMILRWGQEQATKEHLPAYLDSTEEGRRAYDKAGFVPGPEWTIDFMPHGVHHLNTQWPMRWTPPAMNGSA